MIKPRNTLVVVRVIEKAEKQVGNITVPTSRELYTEAEVIAVGPGSIAAEGGRTETFDLKPGQRVWIKHKERRGPNPAMPAELAGIRYQSGDEFLYVFEQSSIVGIISEPGEAPASEPDTGTTPKLVLN